jgi:hypothetical protein
MLVSDYGNIPCCILHRHTCQSFRSRWEHPVKRTKFELEYNAKHFTFLFKITYFVYFAVYMWESKDWAFSEDIQFIYAVCPVRIVFWRSQKWFVYLVN